MLFKRLHINVDLEMKNYTGCPDKGKKRLYLENDN